MKLTFTRAQSILRYPTWIFALLIPGVVIALSVCLYLGISTTMKKSDDYVGPSIKVYGRIIKDEDFNRYLRYALQASQPHQINGEIRDAAITSALRDAAMEEEIRRAALKANLAVSTLEVESFIKQRFPMEESLHLFMERQGYRTEKEFKKSVFQNLKWQKFMIYKAHQLKVTVPKDEVLGMMEEITVSHIFVGIKHPASNEPLRSDQEALKRAEEVYQKLMVGADFAQLAQEYSDYPAAKEEGGIFYGPMTLTMFKMSMEQSYVDSALRLKEGQISRPVKTVKTQLGYYIIRMESLRLPKGNEYQAKYREIEDELLIRNLKETPAFKAYLEKIYDGIGKHVEILDPALQAFRFKQQQKWAEAAKAYQKALEKNYYQKQIDVILDAAGVYLKLKQPQNAIQVLQRASGALTNTIEFQKTLASAYQENGESQKAQDILKNNPNP